MDASGWRMVADPQAQTAVIERASASQVLQLTNGQGFLCVARVERAGRRYFPKYGQSSPDSVRVLRFV